jgi:hypothetical protein
MREVPTWADRFWRLAGGPEPFPRQLEIPVAWALPLVIIKLPRLGIAELLDWMSKTGICMKSSFASRPLRACLIARAGRGAVLLAGTDPDDERRLSLAHEVAHFLIDYLKPREEALSALGPTVLDVLDGLRQPTPEERLTGTLRGIELDVYTHLMERSDSGQAASADTIEREDKADRLALELIAPLDVVTSQLVAEGIDWRGSEALQATVHRLVAVFGLPKDAAERYGRSLLMAKQPASSFRAWLNGEGGLSNSC